MASRLISFLSEWRSALLSSAVAALFCVLLFMQWQSHKAQQAWFFDIYSKAAPHFSAGEMERHAPSADHLVIFAVTTGIWIAVALTLWRQCAVKQAMLRK